MSDQPATKQDLAEAVRQINLDLAETTEKLTEAIRDSQTEVVRGFYEWARPVEVRLRSADDLGRRMSWLEDRVSELERGKRLRTAGLSIPQIASGK